MEEKSSGKVSSKSQIFIGPKSQKLYPGDLIALPSVSPFENFPNFASVLSPTNALVQYIESQKFKKSEESQSGGQNFNSVGQSESRKFLNYETGLTDPIYVQWLNSRKISTLEQRGSLVSRNIIKGLRVRNFSGIEGTIMKTSSKVSLQILNTSQVIDKVETEHLLPISPVVRGREILYEGWLGVISTVRRDVISKIDNGGLIFTLKTIESDGFMKNDPYWGPGTAYAGAKNKYSSTVMKSATFNSRFVNFFHRYFSPITYFVTGSKATTLGVITTSIDVIWIKKCPNMTELAQDSSPSIPPPVRLERENLEKIQFLGLPNYELAGLNSVRIYKNEGERSLNHVFLSYDTWFSIFKKKYLNDGSSSASIFKNTKESSTYNLMNQKGCQMPVKVICKQTYAEVQWDNGENERLSSEKIPTILGRLDDDLFPPGLIVQHILETSENITKYGAVVYNNDYNEESKMVSVLWLQPSTNCPHGDVCELGVKKESIYDLRPHPNVSMSIQGSLVLINNKSDHKIGTVTGFELQKGKLVVLCAGLNEEKEFYPHELSSVGEYCYWDFYKKSWKIEPLLPSIYKVIYEGIHFPKENSTPVSLTAVNNNNSGSRIGLKSIWDEPTFELVPTVPTTHSFINIPPCQSPSFVKKCQREILSIRNSVPEGIWIRIYEDRTDLYSGVILGPEKIPYEDNLFFFEMQLTENFPKTLPRIKAIPFTTQSLHPFISTEGGFCTSKLDWEFCSNTEKYKSFVAHAFQKIQALICISSHPFLKQFGNINEEELSEEDLEKSRSYNEQILLGILSSFYNMTMSPLEPWRKLTAHHLSLTLPDKIATVRRWMASSEDGAEETKELPPFPLFPVSDGFKKSINLRLQLLELLLPPPTPINDEIDYYDNLAQNSSESTVESNARLLDIIEPDESDEKIKGPIGITTAD